MKKILIIGCPGSRKSTFARKLQKITGLPLFYLDMLWHKPDKTTYSREEFDQKLNEILKQERWIIDGNYKRTILLRLSHCDTVFWLDYPLEVCLQGIRARKGKPRPDMPWVETEEDEEFMEWVRSFPLTERERIKELLEESSKKNIIVFHSREESEKYLQAITGGDTIKEEIIEEMYSGFCKALNETRTVFCEFVEKDGKRSFSQADCAYGTCPHSKTCQLMKQVEEM